MMLSIVIPTLNEAGNLARTIAQTRKSATANARMEVILSDCGSRDGTTALARELNLDHVTSGATCRADALNRGAAVARGDTLLFLHADSILPRRFNLLIYNAICRHDVVGGAFDFAFGPRPENHPLTNHCLDWVVMINRVRFRWTGNFYGDQCIFVRRNVFQQIGGFPDVSLLEDIRFSARLQRAGRTVILRPPVVTSPRRFLHRGVIRQFAQDLALLACESAGLSHEALWRRYNRLNCAGHPDATVQRAEGCVVGDPIGASSDSGSAARNGAARSGLSHFS